MISDPEKFVIGLLNFGKYIIRYISMIIFNTSEKEKKILITTVLGGLVIILLVYYFTNDNMFLRFD